MIVTTGNITLPDYFSGNRGQLTQTRTHTQTVGLEELNEHNIDIHSYNIIITITLASASCCCIAYLYVTIFMCMVPV